MGLLDDAASVISGRPPKRHHKSSRHRDRSNSSRSRSRSRTRHSIAGSIFGGDSHHSRHNSSRGSFFGLPNVSSRSFFGIGGSSRPSSYYKRSPRPNFVSRMYRQLKRLLRDLVHYAKRHPMKVFMLVIAPLITGGALTALLARFGLGLPPGLERMMGIGAKAMSGDGIGLVGEAVRMAGGLGAGGGKVSLERGADGLGRSWEKKSWEKDLGFGGDDGGGGGWGALSSVAGMAKMFF